MRCDKKIYLCQKGEKTYNSNTGNYTESEPIKFEKYAKVTDATTEIMNLLFGGVKQGVLVVRLNERFADKIDYIEIDNNKYEIKIRRTLKFKETYTVMKL